MGTILFLTFIFLHVAFALALAFFVLYFAAKVEQSWLKNLGFITGWLLIILALVSMTGSSIYAAKNPHFLQHKHPHYMHEKMHEKFMEKGMPMMQEQKEDDDAKKGRKTGAACPTYDE